MAAGGASPLDGAQPLVRLEGVTKRFGDVLAVDGLSLDIAAGEFFALLGPSGCGKTTLLRILAGFETPEAGRVILDGEDISAMPPYQRPVNMMFQNYALFPHLTVERNIAFGLRQENLARKEIRVRVREMMALVQIEPLARRKPHQLSGGQRQRVALARALVKRPKVFLLDEPLAALDKKLRAETQFELKQLKRRLGQTFIIVTHDQEEAMTMADRIGVMDHGRLVQVAAPAEVYEHPNSRWVAQFVGDVNLLEGRIVETGPAGIVIETEGAGRILAPRSGAPNSGSVAVAIRPEKVRIARAQSTSSQANAVRGRVEDIGYFGNVSLYKVRLDAGAVMKATMTNLMRVVHQPIAQGEMVWLSFAPEACVVLTR
jgi:putrescine transport system ATP-binding protein